MDNNTQEMTFGTRMVDTLFTELAGVKGSGHHLLTPYIPPSADIADFREMFCAGLASALIMDVQHHMTHKVPNRTVLVDYSLAATTISVQIVLGMLGVTDEQFAELRKTFSAWLAENSLRLFGVPPGSPESADARPQSVH